MFLLLSCTSHSPALRLSVHPICAFLNLAVLSGEKKTDEQKQDESEEVENHKPLGAGAGGGLSSSCKVHWFRELMNSVFSGACFLTVCCHSTLTGGFFKVTIAGLNAVQLPAVGQQKVAYSNWKKVTLLNYVDMSFLSLCGDGNSKQKHFFFFFLFFAIDNHCVIVQIVQKSTFESLLLLLKTV